ncbi:thiamine-triphosphatase [Varanus komodoensis]|uniref:thiamine-triphosphatase n=1 Tax=Varanus komodoensis TaxID=61221 RepID=UPI001CF7864C|nr:thiamine-triphosphatase [Varanus komodoensis]
MDAAAAGKGAAEPASGLIEVEQKFLSGPDTAEKLVALGATLDGILTFRDRYYDRADYRLTLADHWLREREGAGWELKCPPPSTASVSGPTSGSATESLGPRRLPQTASSPPAQQPLQALEVAGRPHTATHYLEVTSPRETVARICALLGVDPALAWHDDVAAAVEELGLQEFASFVTQRSKYRLGDLNVVLDEMDFGYAVGEVEAMVRQEEVPAALEQIRKLGVHLGFDETTRFPGKMSAYLYKFKPAQYNALLQRGRVADGTNREGART